jgi:hypothetical protein
LNAHPSAQGAVEAFDLPVRLRPVGPGLLRCDAEVGAGVAPQVRLVAAAVVGQHALDGDAAVGKPGHGVLEDLGRGFLGFVVVGLDVGDAGVVVDHGVQVAGPDQRLVVLVLGPARSQRGC